MVQAGTILKVTDKTAVVLVECLKVFGPIRKRIAYLGDIVLVSVKKLNIKNKKFKRQKKNGVIQGVLCHVRFLCVQKLIFVEYLVFLLSLTKMLLF